MSCLDLRAESEIRCGPMSASCMLAELLLLLLTEFDIPLHRQQDIIGFDVAMDDAALMQVA
jgi:hypothetical protein